MKIIFKSFILGFISPLILLTLPVVNASETYSKGDVNGDKLIDAIDASVILSKYAMISTGQNISFTDIQLVVGDIDHNGMINAVDASKVLSFYSYVSTGGTLSIGKYFNIPENTATTTISPQPIVTTTIHYTQAGYTKYDLLNPDHAIATKAFEKLSKELWKELYDGRMFDGPFGMSTGYRESKVILAIINHDQNIAPEVLASDEALGRCSLEEVLAYSHILGFGYLEQSMGKSVDFNKYIINEEFADFVNKTDEAYLSGNMALYEQIMDDYYSQYNDIEDVDDYIKFCHAMSLDYDLGIISRYGLEEAERLCEEKVARPLYDSYSQYIGHSYT